MQMGCVSTGVESQLNFNSRSTSFPILRCMNNCIVLSYYVMYIKWDVCTGTCAHPHTEDHTHDCSNTFSFYLLDLFVFIINLLKMATIIAVNMIVSRKCP